MTIWIEEELFPEDSNENLGAKGNPSNKAISAFVRIHEPRIKNLSSTEIKSIDFTKPDHHYTLVKLECELDPGNEARKVKAGFISAKVSVPAWGDGKTNTKVFALFPLEIQKGALQAIKLKLEPTIDVASAVKIGLGSLEADALVGQVAPSIVGFKGNQEMRPYWNLEHNNQAPLYGTRHFWLLLETPKASKLCYISCHIVASLQTLIGPIYLGPKKNDITNRPRFPINF